MSRKLAARILDSMLPSPSPEIFFGNIPGHANSMASDSKNLAHTGTTVIAFKYKNGILFAADRKTSGGYLSIISLDTIKIEQIGPNSACGCAGLVADAQFAKRALGEAVGSFKGNYGFDLSTEGQASYLSNLCTNFRFLINPWSFGLEIQAIIGGVDISGDFEIFEVSGEGSLYKKDYAVIGSGTDHAMSVLRDKKAQLLQRSLNLNAAMMLAVKSIFRAGEADNGTSDIRVATPNIAVITKNGFKFISEKSVRKIVLNIIEEDKK